MLAVSLIDVTHGFYRGLHTRIPPGNPRGCLPVADSAFSVTPKVTPAGDSDRPFVVQAAGAACRAFARLSFTATSTRDPSTLIIAMRRSNFVLLQPGKRRIAQNVWLR